MCSVALLAPLLGPLLSGRVFVYNDLCVVPPADCGTSIKRRCTPATRCCGRPRSSPDSTCTAKDRSACSIRSINCCTVVLPLAAAFNLELIDQLSGGVRRNVLVPAPPPVQPRGGALRRDAVRVQRLQPAAPPSHEHGGRRRPHAVAAGRRRRADRRRAEAGAGRRVCGDRARSSGPNCCSVFRRACGGTRSRLARSCVFRAGETRAMAAAAAAVRQRSRSASCSVASSSCRRSMPRPTRCGWMSTHEFALTLSLHPFNLFQLWSPYFFGRGAYSVGEPMLFHEFGIYSGAILQVALIWVWIRRRALARAPGAHHRGHGLRRN